MAQVCPHCGSDNVQTMVRTIHCLECLKHTPYPVRRGDAEEDA